MKILLGADHRGFELKEGLKNRLTDRGYQVEDLGAHTYQEGDDYVDYVRRVCGALEEGDRGIVICGSGHGVSIAANRHNGVRCILGFNPDVVVQGRQDEDANVLALPADWVSSEQAWVLVELFLKTDFSQAERHVRRIAKLEALI